MCLGVPGRVVDVREEAGLRMGRVDFGGVTRSVCLEHVDVAPGDWVLVHVGFALTRLSPEEASQLLRLLDELALAESAPEEDAADVPNESGAPPPLPGSR